MELATTVALAALRGPVPLAKTLAALDVLSEGRVVAGVGPGSSERDYDAVGMPYAERWERFDEAVAILRSLLRGEPPPEPVRHYALPASQLAPGPRRPGGVPLWIGSWGSPAGLRRVARLGDGWLASAYNATPEVFAARGRRCRTASTSAADPNFPNALATMWTWITEDASDADRVLREVLAPMLKRMPMSCAPSCASDRRTRVPSCSRASRRRAVSGSTSGRWATTPRGGPPRYGDPFVVIPLTLGRRAAADKSGHEPLYRHLDDGGAVRHAGDRSVRRARECRHRTGPGLRAEPRRRPGHPDADRPEGRRLLLRRPVPLAGVSPRHAEQPRQLRHADRRLRQGHQQDRQGRRRTPAAASSTRATRTSSSR